MDEVCGAFLSPATWTLIYSPGLELAMDCILAGGTMIIYFPPMASLPGEDYTYIYAALVFFSLEL